MIEIRVCGRPKRDGAPCKNHLQPGQVACPRHATVTERALAEGYWKWHREGYRAGEEEGRTVEQLEIDDEGRLSEERDRRRQEARAQSGSLAEDQSSEADVALAEAYDERWQQGFDDGFESGRKSVRLQAEYERRRQALEEEERARFRERDGRGQLVMVERGKALTYRWTGDGDLRVGDRVLVPGNWLHPNAEVCTVVAIGSSFNGDIQEVIRRASPEPADSPKPKQV
jgi:hypothetical protein